MQWRQGIQGRRRITDDAVVAEVLGTVILHLDERGCPAMVELLVDELPCVRSIEPTDSHRCNEFGIEVPEVHAVFRAKRRL